MAQFNLMNQIQAVQICAHKEATETSATPDRKRMKTANPATRITNLI